VAGRDGPVLRVALVSLRRRLVTDATDNLPTGFKGLRDAVAASLGVDDADSRVAWEYRQVQTSGREGTVVVAEWLI